MSENKTVQDTILKEVNRRVRNPRWSNRRTLQYKISGVLRSIIDVASKEVLLEQMKWRQLVKLLIN